MGVCDDGGKGRWGWVMMVGRGRWGGVEVCLFAVCRRSMIIGIRLVTTLAIRYIIQLCLYNRW